MGQFNGQLVDPLQITLLKTSMDRIAAQLDKEKALGWGKRIFGGVSPEASPEHKLLAGIHAKLKIAHDALIQSNQLHAQYEEQF